MVSDDIQSTMYSNQPPLKISQRDPGLSGRDFDINPSLFPESYPGHIWTPALSQASTSSTRSSVFTSQYRSSHGSRHMDFDVADDLPTREERGLVVATTEPINFDEPKLVERSVSQPRLDSTSRPSLYGRSKSSTILDTQWSNATSWVLDDRGETGLTTDEETDHDEEFDNEGDSFGSILIEQAQTNAAVVADEGRGTIVNGEGLPVSRIPIPPGTTHLLLSSSSTPNSLPSFLLTNLPNLSATLLALDISANFLLSLPASLTTLTALEELNISSNPLRALPTFLSSLYRTLRILIADSIGLSNLPIEMACMKRLNVLSLRRNKLHSVPDCVAGMDALEEIKLEGNNFLGPWQALVDPMLPGHRPPNFAQMSVNSPSSNFSISDEEVPTTIEDEHTIRAPLQVNNSTGSRSMPRTAIGQVTDENSLHPLNRMKTLPSNYPTQRSPTPDARPPGQTRSQYHETTPSMTHDAQPAMRRMKSANELRDHRKTAPPQSGANRPGTGRPTLQTSENRAPDIGPSRSNFHRGLGEESVAPGAQRFATLSLGRSLQRQPTSPSLFEAHSSNKIVRSAAHSVSLEPQRRPEIPHKELKVDNQKAKWGFLKKMSMGRLKSPGPPSNQSLRPRERPPTSHVMSAPTVPRVGEVPEIVTSHSADNSRAVTPNNIPPSPLSVSVIGEPSMDGSHSPLASAQQQIKSLRRRSFLPIDGQLSLSILPAISTPIVSELSVAEEGIAVANESGSELQETDRLARAKRTLWAYLQDMLDLNPMALHSNLSSNSTSTNGTSDHWSPEGMRSRRPTVSEGNPGRLTSESSFTTTSSGPGTPLTPLNSTGSFSVRDTESGTSSTRTSMFTTDSGEHPAEERKVKDDKGRRARIVREIFETERTYVQGLQGLMEIYIKPAGMTVSSIGSSSRETVVPPSERKIVFNGLDALYNFHREIFLPALEVAAGPLVKATSLAEADADGQLSTRTARAVANVFLSHAAFMKMYSTYINNFDTAVQRLRMWTLKPTTESSRQGTPNISSAASMTGLATSLSGVPSAQSPDALVTSNANHLTSTQRKRLKAYLKRCRLHPLHSQLNLEGYLLLPVQRVPRYRLMFEELVRCTLPPSDGREDVIENALTEISSLAVNMNEGKRDAESRNKLVLWQTRIRGKFPSPLVQPHRRFIMDGPLQLIRVVRRNSVSFEVLNTEGDTTEVFVDCLTPEDTERSLVGILCNDLLVLCKTPPAGQQQSNQVDLWAVLRMQTLSTPASVVQGSTLRVVDNKAILYFEAPSTSDALTWSRAINLHIPASKA